MFVHVDHPLHGASSPGYLQCSPHLEHSTGASQHEALAQVQHLSTALCPKQDLCISGICVLAVDDGVLVGPVEGVDASQDVRDCHVYERVELCEVCW